MVHIDGNYVKYIIYYRLEDKNNCRKINNQRRLSQTTEQQNETFPYTKDFLSLIYSYMVTRLILKCIFLFFLNLRTQPSRPVFPVFLFLFLSFPFSFTLHILAVSSLTRKQHAATNISSRNGLISSLQQTCTIVDVVASSMINWVVAERCMPIDYDCVLR